MKLTKIMICVGLIAGLGLLSACGKKGRPRHVDTNELPSLSAPTIGVENYSFTVQ